MDEDEDSLETPRFDPSIYGGKSDALSSRQEKMGRGQLEHWLP
jgi:hypothetical protein